jgi:NADH:ubiquinone reductase (non-electrogenic)
MASLVGRLLLNVVSAAAVARVVRPRMNLARAGAMDTLGRPEVAVLGGGFGGLYTALRLCSLDWSGGPKPHVTLVDRDERFSFSPMLYELATGTAATWEVSPSYEELLRDTGVEFVRAVRARGRQNSRAAVRRRPRRRAPHSLSPHQPPQLTPRAHTLAPQEVRGLDDDARIVQLHADGDERSLPYDQCVLAFGMEPARDVVPGIAEHALTFGSQADDALKLRQRLDQLRAASGAEPVRIAIVGGGYVGVELAANLMSWSAAKADAPATRVTLLHRSSSLLPAASDFNRREAERRLADAGVDVRLDTTVTMVGAESLELGGACSGAADGAADEPRELLPAELIVWTAGVRPASVVSSLGLPLDETGRVEADETLRVRGSERLYAIGDAAAVTDARGDPVPPTAQAAMQQADYAAWNVRAALRSEAVMPFRYAALGEMLSLGGDAGSVSALGDLVKLQGGLGAASRRAVYAARMPTPEQAVKVGVSWAVDAALGAVRRVARPPPPTGQ